MTEEDKEGEGQERWAQAASKPAAGKEEEEAEEEEEDEEEEEEAQAQGQQGKQPRPDKRRPRRRARPRQQWGRKWKQQQREWGGRGAKRRCVGSQLRSSPAKAGLKGAGLSDAHADQARPGAVGSRVAAETDSTASRITAGIKISTYFRAPHQALYHYANSPLLRELFALAQAIDLLR